MWNIIKLYFLKSLRLESKVKNLIFLFSLSIIFYIKIIENTNNIYIICAIIMASISCGISMCSTECLLSDVFIKENEYLFSLPIDINKYIISINSFAIINSIYYYLIFIIIIFINSLIRHINLIPKNAILIIPIIFFSLSLGNFITVVNIKRIIFADKDFKNVAKFFKDLLLRFVSVVPNIIIVLLISIYSEKQNIIMVFILFCLSSILMYYLSIITLSKKLKKQDEFLEKLFE